ncbi:MAG: ATP-binding protein, partial [Nitrospiria bacterium]
ETTASALDGTNVRAEFHIPDDLWPAEVDADQIRQVIGHLAANAQQAMPDGGTVTVEIRNRIVGPDDRLPLDPGRYVVVWIIDHGIGIPKAILPRIFDPYFTTKPTRTGLGLATCYSIVKKHRGYIAADSTPGVRTTFTLFLPAAAQPPAPARPVPPPRPGGAVLLMDDDPSICEFAVEMLTQFGYRAACALDGAQAVDLYRHALAEGGPFDVVILDLTVPGGMGGIEALAALREIDPRVRAVVSSGYSNDPVMADWARYGFAGALPKPYEGDQLREIVAQVLGPSRTGGAPPADRAA